MIVAMLLPAYVAAQEQAASRYGAAVQSYRSGDFAGAAASLKSILFARGGSLLTRTWNPFPAAQFRVDFEDIFPGCEQLPLAVLHRQWSANTVTAGPPGELRSMVT